MNFSELWIQRRLVLIILFLITDIIFNCGITPSRSYYLQSKTNSPEAQHFLTDYFGLIFNKSRELNEIIYSDILNNLGNLMRTQNSGIKSTNKYSKNGENLKTEITKCPNKNGTGSLGYMPASVYEVFLNDEEKRENRIINFTFSVPGMFPRDSYLLGYSGKPFGSGELIAGVAEISEDDHGERIIIDPRKKRSVLHLYNMVLCSTGCNPFAYKGYGCYCGFLGSGFVVDGIDSCCKMHDWCYNSAGCPMFLEYFIPYLWKCYQRQPLCAIDHGYYGGPGSCSQRLCECDRQLALCLRRYPCPTTKALCTSSPWRLLQNILML